MDQPNEQELSTVQKPPEGIYRLLEEAYRKLDQDTKTQKFSDRELASMSKNASEAINQKKDFGTGDQREQLTDMFRTATNKGPDAVKQLSDAINKELIEKKSTLRLSGVYLQDSETKDESVQPKDGSLLYVPPLEIKHTYAKGDFSLTDTATGTREDSISVRGKELEKELVFPKTEY